MTEHISITEQIRVGPVNIELYYEEKTLAGPVSNVRRYLYTDQERPSHESKSSDSPTLRLRLHAEERQPSAKASLLGEFSNGFSLMREGSAILLWKRGHLVRLDLEGRSGELWMPRPVATESTPNWTLCVLILESLIFLLRRYRLFGLHAATLSRHGQGVILSAASDSGKSTLAFRLVQHGWDYLSDDTVLLHPVPDHIEVQALRSHFSLDPEAEDIFPEVIRGREAALLKVEKWAVNVETVYPGQRVATCIPRALVFPKIVDANESEMVAIPKSEALRLLVEQSSLARVNLPGSGEHFEVLARLVREVPTYRLRSGRDLLEDPARTHELLEPLLTSWI